jgi:hypothetical protein
MIEKIVERISHMERQNLTIAFSALMLLAAGISGIGCESAPTPVQASGEGPTPGVSHPNTEGWEDLFESDLSSAIFEPGGWVVENGVLRAEDHGTIWTKESYSDFVLDLEFKVAKDANSGVFLRAGDITNVLSALEIQIHETSDSGKYGMVAALYDAKPPSKQMAKPAGEWNRYTITCKGSKLQLIFNGEQVHDLDLNDWNEPHKNPDGTENKFATALKDFSRNGPIGFQGIHGKEGQPVWFRNIKIKPLD